MAAVAFPPIKPRRRQYKPGEFPQRVFKALNGATTIMRFGNRRAGSTMELGFENLQDRQVAAILSHYETVAKSGDWVLFGVANGLAGVAIELQPWLAESKSGLRWRYQDAPAVNSVGPGRSSISVSFLGYLDAGTGWDGQEGWIPDEGQYF